MNGLSGTTPAPLIPELKPVGVGAGKGIDWFIEGWTLFLRAPVIFSVMGAVYLGIMLLLGAIPVIGWIATLLLWPHLTAGLFQASRHAYHGQPVEFADFFSGLTELRPLAALGFISLGALLVLTLMLAASVLGTLGLEVLGTFIAGDLDGFDPREAGHKLALSLLFILLLFTPLLMGFLFSPILIHRLQVPVVVAMRLSLRACLRNFLAFMVWGLVWLVVMAMIMVLMWLSGIGAVLMVLLLVIAGPVYAANLYAAYEGIFQLGDERTGRLL